MRMIFKWMERRRHRRYSVSWNARMGVVFPDFQGEITIKVANFSISGALLHSDQIYLERHHLFITDQPPELIIKIDSPRGLLVLRTDIRWYRWSVEKNLFEVGVEFKKMVKEDQETVNQLIADLKKNRRNIQSAC
jgi:hypothetical protein